MIGDFSHGIMLVYNLKSIAIEVEWPYWPQLTIVLVNKALIVHNLHSQTLVQIAFWPAGKCIGNKYTINKGQYTIIHRSRVHIFYNIVTSQYRDKLLSLYFTSLLFM